MSIEESSVNANNGLVTPMVNVNQEYDVVTVINKVWEDVIEICLYLESVWRSPMAKELVRLADMKTRVDDLKKSYFFALKN